MKEKISSGAAHVVPKDLRTTIEDEPELLTLWNALTPLARNEWLCFIDNAKKAETRAARIQRLQNDLPRGKKRPCCWAGCGHR